MKKPFWFYFASSCLGLSLLVGLPFAIVRLTLKPAERSIAASHSISISDHSDARTYIQQAHQLLQELEESKELFTPEYLTKLTSEELEIHIQTKYKEFQVKENQLNDIENSLVGYLSQRHGDNLEELESQVTLLSLNITHANLQDARFHISEKQKEDLQAQVDRHTKEAQRLRQEQCQKESELAKLRQEIQSLINPQESIIKYIAPETTLPSADINMLMGAMMQLQYQVASMNSFMMAPPFWSGPMMMPPYYQQALLPSFGFPQQMPVQQQQHFAAIGQAQLPFEEMTRVIPSFDRHTVEAIEYFQF